MKILPDTTSLEQQIGVWPRKQREAISAELQALIHMLVSGKCYACRR